MSLNKHVKYCSRCVSFRIGQCFSSSSNAVSSSKMQSKTMSLTQWKAFNYIKECLSKFSNDAKFQSILNREITQLLRKLQPSIYGSESYRFLDSTVEKSSVDGKKEIKTESQGYPFPNVLSGLKIKINLKENENKEAVPKWKNNAPVISKLSIASRTNHVMTSVLTAETEESKLKRIESLIEHVKQFPEVKRQIVKEGVIRLLLRTQKSSRNPTVHAAISEAFALLGFSKPLPSYGIRILSIDGGGIRGLLVIEMLRKLEELSGKKVHEMFDFICGVSTGAIIAVSIGVHQRDLDVLTQHYREISTKVFNQSALWGTGSLVWSHSYYDTSLWEKMLKEYLGENYLISTARNPNCPKVATISAIVNRSRVAAYVFRNYALPWNIQSQYIGGHDHKVWEAVRASAAAPTYFEECKLGNLLHQDGGILVNNPTAVAIHEAKQIWPDYPIQCVVSFGTGRNIPNQLEIQNDQPTSNSSSWKTKFLKILDSATDTEGVHTMLNDLLPSTVYYRFNPYLTEMLSMSEINPKKLEQLERDALMYLRRNEDKFQEATKVLCETKSPRQKILDWLNLKRETMGISMK